MDEGKKYQIIEGDALQELQKLPDETFDGFIADPPYCSGGLTPAATSRGGMLKYLNSDRAGSFSDTMSQISLFDFLRVILLTARAKLKSPGYIFLFTDWRSLPVMASALQSTGAIYRGLVTWSKGKSRTRPNPGQISQTSEFVIWGTKDEAKSDKYVTNSVFEVAPPPAVKRIHPTQKPVELYRELFKILPNAPKVIDLFMGSGVAGVATLDANGDYIGVDNSPEFCRYASTRLNDETKKLF